VVAAATALPPGASREIVFALACWTADHVTEPGLADQDGSAGTGARRQPAGVRVGHVYENHFGSVDGVAAHVLDRRADLEAASIELKRVLETSSLPRWLVRAIENSIDSTLCNTIVPRSRRLYTLEPRPPVGSADQLRKVGSFDQYLSFNTQQVVHLGTSFRFRINRRKLR
jgi:hypothetical protein